MSARLGRAAPLVVFVVVFALHALLIPSQGLTDDDDFYAPAGLRYASWLGDVVTHPTTALTSSSIDAAFTVNHEHPPFAKFVFGVSSFFFHDVVGVFGVLDGARAGCALFAAVACAMLFWWLKKHVGVVEATAAVVLLLSLPRYTFHSEVATLDVPVASMIVVVTALFSTTLKHDGSRRSTVVAAAGVGVGVVFGLACATKLNAPFAALPCVLLVLAERWRGFVLDVTPHGPALRLPRIPTSLWAMALVGPVVFVAVWPWLWSDPIGRLGGYLAFHLKHYPIYLFFDGEIWNEPFAPGRASVVMAVASMPVVVVVLGVIGAVSAASALVRIARGADAEGTTATMRDRVLALSLLQAAFSLGVVALSNVPRYGGEKLFMPFFPFWCALAGRGVVVVASSVVAVFKVNGRGGNSVVVVVVVVAGAAFGVKGNVDFFGGYALSYYGEFVDGLRGAVARGHERTYYDVADKDLARWLDDNARGRRVHVAPNHKEYVRTYRWLKKDGVISRSGVVLVDDIDNADVVVLTHERRWSTYPKLRARLRDAPVLHEKRIDGVPLYTVFDVAAGRSAPQR